MKKEKMALDVVNPHAAGIDVGSRSHYVAIGQRDEDVKEFGVYNEDLMALGQWLLENEVRTVAERQVPTGKVFLPHYKVLD
jgi:transposase